MKKFAIFMLLVIATGILAGCSDNTEAGAVDKYTEIQNQTKNAGGEEQKP